ncbi:MAG: sugar phosphate nucleotidyltransferase [Lachnospiraceae bacterium]|nr:sugar phosphate nucleotidyltransferase [Lachnospiraceae bacterium]
MQKPVLVIMAAGMGSRYGGLKQIEPVDEQGHIIMDFSIFDAKRAGFEKVIFIIKRENEAVFKECIGNRICKYIEVVYVYQELMTLPYGYAVPAGRTRPFGTGHAILSCKEVIDGPFVVVNADDYYGVQGFRLTYDFLLRVQESERFAFAMVGYQLKNTLTENGFVSRGVCQVDTKGNLTSITELVHIEKQGGKAVFTMDGGKSWEEIDPASTVSMNLFGFTKNLMKELEIGFLRFLETDLAANPLKAEYFLPTVVGSLIEQGKACVEVLKSEDRWYGITYQEDKQGVKDAIEQMKRDGIYPKELWS